jgi:hypothetical protein
MPHDQICVLSRAGLRGMAWLPRGLILLAAAAASRARFARRSAIGMRRPWTRQTARKGSAAMRKTGQGSPLIGLNLKMMSRLIPQP